MSELDPALVAAGSSAAESLIAASSPIGGVSAATIAAVQPSGELTLSAGAPVEAASRYADAGTAVHRDDSGRELVHLRRRLVPPPERLATVGYEEVEPGDRADLVSARAVGDPTLFWQLCDANAAFDAAELEVAGSRLRVALPEGFPGVPGA